MLGGASGLINASYTVNLVVHNTSFIVGHFHLTVGTAVALSIMGISYWLVPSLTGRALWRPKLAVIQTWTWFIGMIIFSNAMHVLGLLGDHLLRRLANLPARRLLQQTAEERLRAPLVVQGDLQGVVRLHQVMQICMVAGFRSFEPFPLPS